MLLDSVCLMCSRNKLVQHRGVLRGFYVFKLQNLSIFGIYKASLKITNYSESPQAQSKRSPKKVIKSYKKRKMGPVGDKGISSRGSQNRGSPILCGSSGI